MPKKTKADIEKEAEQERNAEYDRATEVLSRYGLRRGDTIRFRLKDNPNGTWSSALVRGINKDMSIDALDHHNSGRRAIRPGHRYDVDVKGVGPRKGVTWAEVKTLEE